VRVSEHSIRIVGAGPLARIDLDGQRIDNMVTGVSVNMVSRELPEVQIDLLAPDLDIALGRVHVRIDDTTRDFLVALGWRPPPDEEDV
jgi:hypothetical protein